MDRRTFIGSILTAGVPIEAETIPRQSDLILPPRFESNLIKRDVVDDREARRRIQKLNQSINTELARQPFIAEHFAIDRVNKNDAYETKDGQPRRFYEMAYCSAKHVVSKRLNESYGTKSPFHMEILVTTEENNWLSPEEAVPNLAKIINRMSIQFYDIVKSRLGGAFPQDRSSYDLVLTYRDPPEDTEAWFFAFKWEGQAALAIRMLYCGA